MLSTLLNFESILTNTTFKSASLQNLLKSDEKFDAIIIDSFGNEAFFGFGHHFNAQVIAMSTGSTHFVNHFSGNVAPYAFVPNVLTTYSDKMTFIDRVVNTCMGIIFQVYKYVLFYLQEVQYKKQFKGGPELNALLKNVSVILVNSHVIFETPRPYLPNMIPVGGIHITEPKKLPEVKLYLEIHNLLF